MRLRRSGDSTVEVDSVGGDGVEGGGIFVGGGLGGTRGVGTGSSVDDSDAVPVVTGEGSGGVCEANGVGWSLTGDDASGTSATEVSATGICATGGLIGCDGGDDFGLRLERSSGLAGRDFLAFSFC